MNLKDPLNLKYLPNLKYLSDVCTSRTRVPIAPMYPAYLRYLPHPVVHFPGYIVTFT